jgi:hypothetical protein
VLDSASRTPEAAKKLLTLEMKGETHISKEEKGTEKKNVVWLAWAKAEISETISFHEENMDRQTNFIHKGGHIWCAANLL